MKYMGSHATFSECKKYRYTLYRRWGKEPILKSEAIAFCGLNPSTADATQDDPTIRRCRNFAIAWGYSAMYMLNIFALRSTDPKLLYTTEHPVGQFNDNWIRRIFNKVDCVVACWGAHGGFNNRDKKLTRRFEFKCLGVTKEGFPKHPLYLPNGLELLPYEGRK